MPTKTVHLLKEKGGTRQVFCHYRRRAFLLAEPQKQPAGFEAVWVKDTSLAVRIAFETLVDTPLEFRPHKTQAEAVSIPLGKAA